MAPAKKRKATQDPDDAANLAVNNFIYYGTGQHCHNPKVQEQAALIKEEYEEANVANCGDAFAKKFLEKKKSKDFTWVKGYSEAYTVTEDESSKVGENYMTPS